MKRETWDVRCERCDYTHGAIIGCCPVELRRHSPNHGPGHSATRTAHRRDAADQEPRKISASHRPRNGRPAAPTQVQTPQRPEQPAADRKPDSGLLKDVWFQDSPLAKELQEAYDARNPDKGDSRQVKTQQ